MCLAWSPGPRPTPVTLRGISGKMMERSAHVTMFFTKSTGSTSDEEQQRLRPVQFHFNKNFILPQQFFIGTIDVEDTTFRVRFSGSSYLIPLLVMVWARQMPLPGTSKVAPL